MGLTTVDILFQLYFYLNEGCTLATSERLTWVPPSFLPREKVKNVNKGQQKGLFSGYTADLRANEICHQDLASKPAEPFGEAVATT